MSISDFSKNETSEYSLCSPAKVKGDGRLQILPAAGKRLSKTGLTKYIYAEVIRFLRNAIVMALVPALPLIIRAQSHPPGSSQGTVYVVHAIDTETRQLAAFPYSQNLNLYDYDDTGTVGRLMTDSSRSAFVDSYGAKVKFTWFVLTHEAYRFSQQNDELIVLHTLNRFQPQMQKFGDGIGWHYHNCDWVGDSNEDTVNGRWSQLKTFDGTRYHNGTDISLAEEKVAMLILDGGIYPSTFRGGWDWENNDFSNWLDDILPFDFSNASPLPVSLDSGNAATKYNQYDWSRAPADWSHYHPDSADYERPGQLKHYDFRCLPGHRCSELDFTKAFAEAERGEDVLVCTYAHELDDLSKFCRVTSCALRNAQMVYPGVRFKYVTALEGARAILMLADTIPPVLKVKLTGEIVSVTSDKPLFTYPFGAAKDNAGRYLRLKPVEKSPARVHDKYRWDFDLRGIDWREFAVGGCAVAGNAAVSEKVVK
jgi:hypothetical protein